MGAFLLNLALGAVLVATSVSTAIVALLTLSASLPTRSRSRIAAVPPAQDPAIFLFEDETLIDATPAAYGVLKSVTLPGSDWERLCAHLGTHFPDLALRMSALADRGEIEMEAANDPNLRLRAEYLSGLARITLTDLAAEGCGVIVDALSQRAQEDEIGALRDMIAADPSLIWRSDTTGAVTWANRAYLEHAAQHLGIAATELVWPLPKLLDCGAEPGDRRIRMAGGMLSWFDCRTVLSPPGALHFATSADALLRAEGALGEFVQTLTKTFAHLPIGLAIFDRQRQLALFNPALTDLTTLGPEFLTARPTLYAFLDHLREARMMPEPKDYHGWRQSMAKLEQAAASGQYEETWHLPGGQTYRVTGRPHPQGAVALLFEDISSEISLSRRFRSEIELGHEIVDSIEEAICVFSPAGEVMTSNAAYARLWGHEPGATLGTVTVLDTMRHWLERSHPNAVWGDLRDFVTEIGERAPWADTVRLRDGREVHCRMVPLTGGATLVGFSLLASASRPVRRLRRLRRRSLATLLAE